MSLLLLLLLFLFSISPPTVLPIQPVSSIPTAYCLTSLSSSCHYILLMLYISPTLNTEVFFFFLFIFVFVSPYFMYMFEQTNDMSKQTELMNTPEQWTTRIIALTLGLLLLEKLSTLWLSYCYSSTSSVAFYEWLRWWYFCGLPCICPIIFQRCVDFFFFFLLNISSLNINFLSLSLKEKSCSYCHFLLKLKTYEEEEIVICWFLNLYHD